MSAWDFLSTLDSTTILVALAIALAAVLALVLGVVLTVYRLTGFVLKVVQLPKSRRRVAIELVKRLPPRRIGG